MNIKQAAEQIKNAMQVYFLKDEYGNYIMPPEKQRPVFLVGAPGIGKTAIIEQIAEEMGVGIVTYSMTHHTRQSALGLPFITTKKYGGRDYEVSEYTMSEIIASVYEYIEKTGVSEGILFLDEINCVSETLAPSMLQFLQYKIFGTHRVPEGWIVVTAGNPPEFNKSVREFDIATLDRLKKIDIEPDYGAWREYAVKKGVHPAVISYLDAKNNDFYHIETLPSGNKNYVTARGWEDLSQMLILYEKTGIPVTTELVRQYLQDAKTAADFTDSYSVYNIFMSFCPPEDIANGLFDASTVEKCKERSAAEKLCMAGAMQRTVVSAAEKAVRKENAVTKAMNEIKLLCKIAHDKEDFIRELSELTDSRAQSLRDRQQARTVSKETVSEDSGINAILCSVLDSMKSSQNENLNEALRCSLSQTEAELKELISKATNTLGNTLNFAHEAFGNGNEFSMLLSAITENSYSSRFIRNHGSEEYMTYIKNISFTDRRNELLKKIETITI